MTFFTCTTFGWIIMNLNANHQRTFTWEYWIVQLPLDLFFPFTIQSSPSPIFYSTKAIHKWHCIKIFNNKLWDPFTVTSFQYKIQCYLFLHTGKMISWSWSYSEQLFLFSIFNCMQIMMLLWARSAWRWAICILHICMLSNVRVLFSNHTDPYYEKFAWQKRQLKLKWMKQFRSSFKCFNYCITTIWTVWWFYSNTIEWLSAGSIWIN